MKKREKIPEERQITIRQEILRFLEDGHLTVGDLSVLVGKAEKELYDHLEHLRISGSVEIIPAECLKCGYVFKERKKVKKPGKCPECKGTYIKKPLFRAAKN